MAEEITNNQLSNREKCAEWWMGLNRSERAEFGQKWLNTNTPFINAESVFEIYIKEFKLGDCPF